MRKRKAKMTCNEKKDGENENALSTECIALIVTILNDMVKGP